MNDIRVFFRYLNLELLMTQNYAATSFYCYKQDDDKWKENRKGFVKNKIFYWKIKKNYLLKHENIEVTFSILGIF